mmetsp:Transcript_8073/g.29981  ORF Transcript_8073/g.29981 Transcript_8073/m.29981 type:complete len:118 (-) Transcript_8073:118-471(-)
MDRASVAILYLSTELYMLTDVSQDFEDTWDFLDRKVEDMNYIRNAASLGASANGGSGLGASLGALSAPAASLVSLVQEYIITLTSPQPRYPRWQEQHEAKESAKAEVDSSSSSGVGL